jgi:phosphoglycolate phosphatase-like HAD superfamily hydrolase
MADVQVFDLDGTSINVKDDTARTLANAAANVGAANSQDIANLKALSRLTMSYDAQTETISFTTVQH